MNNKKNLIWVVIILIILVVGAYFLFFQKNDEFVVRDKDSFTSQQDVLDYFEQYKQAQSKDIYGGKTPEETLGLFVDALKNGDVDLASKYFVLSKQEEIKEDLGMIKQRDNFEKFLPILTSQTEKHFYEYDNSYEFNFLNNEKVSIFSLFLSLNRESNLWKIEDL